MTFKMVATDMDWTLLDENKRIPVDVFEGFKKITAAGGSVVIATGRDRESAFEMFTENDHTPGQDGYPYAFAVANEIFYLQDGDYVPDEAWNTNAEKWWSESRILAKQIIDEIVPKLWDYIYERVSDDGLFFICLEDAVEVQEIMIQYMKHEGIDTVFLERNGWGLGLSDARLGKGICLDRISRTKGLKPQDVVAIGDSNNDRPMLDGQIGFFPTCPANSDEEIKKLVQDKGGIVAGQKYGMGVVEIMDRAFSLDASAE